MIFRISWAADPCRSGTMWIRPKKLVFTSYNMRSYLNRYSSVTHGLATLLTFYFTTRDRPLSKPHGPWPAEVGGP